MDQGLGFDLATLGRRQLLRALGLGTVAIGAAACGTSTSSAATSAGEIPDETAGPFPGDGSNGPNVLTESGIVRDDIRSSFGAASGRAEGVPMTLELTLTDLAGGGKPFAGAAVYVWHCTREGEYSLYSPNVAERELPPRRAGRRLRRPGAFHQRLPRLLRRTLAARPLRGLRRPGGHRRREQCDRHLPGRAAEGGLRPGVRPQRIPGVGGEPRPAQPGRRQRLRRRRRAPASSRRPPATRARGSRWRSPCRWTRPPLRRRPAGQGVVHRPERPADERCRPVAGVAIVRLWPVCQNHPVAGIRRRAPWKTSCTPCSRTTPRNRPYRARRQHPRRPQPARRPRAGADRRDPGAGLVGSPRPHWPSRPL